MRRSGKTAGYDSVLPVFDPPLDFSEQIRHVSALFLQHWFHCEIPVQGKRKPGFQFSNVFEQAIGPPAEFVAGAIPEPEAKVQM
jgi:hypothetical protein